MARRVLKVDCAGDVRRLPVSLPDLLELSQGGPERPRRGAPEGAAEVVRAVRDAVSRGYGLASCLGGSPAQGPGSPVLRYRDAEGDLCVLVEATVEDFVTQSGTGPLRLFFDAAHGPLPAAAGEGEERHGPGGPRAAALAADDAGRAQGQDAPGDGRQCRGVGPARLFACLQALRDAHRLTPHTTASLALQFLPLLAQRAQRKRERLNRTGADWRAEGPALELLRRAARELGRVPEARPLLPALGAFVAGGDTAHLGDLLAAALRVLAGSTSREGVARALLALAEELRAAAGALLPPPPAGQGSRPASPAELVQGGVPCGRCGVRPIVGPRFEAAGGDTGEATSICGECFIVWSTEGGGARDCVCHLFSADAATVLRAEQPDFSHCFAQRGRADRGGPPCHLSAAAEQPWPSGGSEAVQNALACAARASPQTAGDSVQSSGSACDFSQFQ